MSPRRLLARGAQVAAAATAGVLLTWQSESNPMRLLCRQLQPESQLAAMNRQRTGPEVTATCTKLRLPPPELAQHMPPIILRGFLSPKEVHALLRAAKRAQRQHVVGMIERNPQGESGRKAAGKGVWRTSYLHTDDWFGANFPALAHKIRQGALSTAAHLPDNAQLASFVEQHNPTELHFRTVELHEYGPRGNLGDHQHYDAGSLLTIDVMLSRRGVDGDFDGGQFLLPVHDKEEDADNQQGSAAQVIDEEFSCPGDVLIFPSHKCVQPLARPACSLVAFYRHLDTNL